MEFVKTHFQNLAEQVQNFYQGLFSKLNPTTSLRPTNYSLRDPEMAIDTEVERPKFSLTLGARRAFRSPPNFQLNQTSDQFGRCWEKKDAEILLAAIIGILLQIGLIVIAAMVAYRIRSNSSDLFETKPCEFSCYAAGSVLLSLGTGLCSFIVERSTDEYFWDALVDRNSVSDVNAPRFLWLQNKQSVSDQSFNGYVIAAGPKRRIITSSRRDISEKHRKSEDTKDERDQKDKDPRAETSQEVSSCRR